MNAQALMETAKALVADDKGVLAMDESNGTCNERFVLLGIAPTEENRRAYRELLISTPGLGDSISGAILFDETIRQSTRSGVRFVDVLAQAGIIPGIKVNTGARDLAAHPGEKVTEGLDSLRDRLAEYAAMVARFAKRRAVIAISTHLLTRTCIEANAQSLARYAALCQETQLVPIVVVLAGLDCPQQPLVDEVASATVQCLLRSVPAAVPAIAFLSGGQSSELATQRLNAMHARFRPTLPWALSFSFARALQQPALETWRGDNANTAAAQNALNRRAQLNRAARRGEYRSEMESA